MQQNTLDAKKEFRLGREIGNRSPFQQRYVAHKFSVSVTEKNIDTAVHLMNHASLSSAICSLQIVCSDDIRRINEGNVSVTLPLTPHHRTGQLLNAVSSTKDMIDALALTYPAAKFAWSIVSVGINVTCSHHPHKY